MLCVKCSSDYITKYGKRSGKQCYLCKTCGCQFTGDKNFIENEKRVALTLAVFGMSSRKISTLLGYSHPTILNWIKEFEKTRTSPREDYFMNLDDLSSFLHERSKNPQGRKFTGMQAALTWNVENEMSKAIEKILSSLTENN